MRRQKIDKEKEQLAKKWKNILLEKLAQKIERDPVATHINADLSLSRSNDGSEKEDESKFVPVPRKVRVFLQKR